MNDGHPSTASAASDPRFAEGVAYVDGAYVPVREARVPLLDWGFLRSDAFQETVSVWDGAFFRLDDHLARFRRSAERLRMTVPDDVEIRAVLHGLVARTGLREAYVQFLMTRGVPPVGSRDVRLAINRFQAFAIPYVWIATPEVQRRGLHLHVSDRRRIPPQSVDPQVKHYHWLEFQLGLLDAYDAGAETVVLKDLDGNVAEGPGFNLFVVTAGRLATPPAVNVLDGMTRRTVLELLDDLQLKAEQRPVDVAELVAADEVFLTTTAGGVLPVTLIDGAPVAQGVPGPIAVQLQDTYWAKRKTGWLATPVDYAVADGSRA
jgi:branched-chain amino acid aminotransferase